MVSRQGALKAELQRLPEQFARAFVTLLEKWRDGMADESRGLVNTYSHAPLTLRRVPFLGR